MPSSETTNVPAASLEELEREAVEAYLRAHAPHLAAEEIPLGEALAGLKLAGSMGKRAVPTLAALYVFGRCPQLLAPQLGVVCAAFEGHAITDPIRARADLDGPLPALLEGAMAFLEQHARPLVNQVDPSDQELEFVREAAREALVNALVHRDLRAGGPVALRLLEDRLEVWSPGGAAGLQRSMAECARSGGISAPRNPLLARLARQLGLSHQLGRGLARMRRLIEEQRRGQLGLESSREGVLVSLPSAIASPPQDPLAPMN